MATHSFWRLNITAGTYGTISEWVPYDGGGSPIATTGGTASADDSTFGAAANAFDGNPSTFWSPSGPSTFPHWLKYHFPSAVEIASFTVVARQDIGAAEGIADFDLQYSDDGSTWTTKYTYRGVPWQNVGQVNTFNASNALPPLGIAWRVLVNTSYASSQLQIGDIVFKDGGGSAIATTKYAATASDTYTFDQTHAACVAFNGDGITTYTETNVGVLTGWIAYRFGSLTSVASFCITPNAPNGPNSVTLQYSFDETNWTSAGTVSVANSATQQCFSLGATLPAGASIVASPALGIQGNAYTVTITGTGTNFSAGVTTVAFSGSGGTVSAVSVSSATSLTFTLTLTATAALGAKTITVTTGAQAPTATFTVTTGARGNIDWDQIGEDARLGAAHGILIQYSDGTFTTGNLPQMLDDGTLTDSGIPATAARGVTPILDSSSGEPIYDASGNWIFAG